MNYLVSMSPKLGQLVRGVVFDLEIFEAINSLLQTKEFNVVLGNPEHPDWWETIGYTIPGYNDFRGGVISFSIRLNLDRETTAYPPDEILAVINDPEYGIYPTIKIDADFRDVVSTEDDVQIIHAAGPVKMQNILFCKK